MEPSCGDCGRVHATSGWLDRLTEKVDRLTERELDVFTRMSSGPPDIELAKQLAITERTIRAHLISIRTKLDGITRHELIVAAFMWNGEDCRSRQ